MAQQIKSTSGDLSAAPVAAASDHSEMIALSARTRTMEQADAVIARRLNGPLTALLRYMSEIKQRSDRMAEASDERAHLKSIVEHALQQTE
jgi:hypothetical protein